MPVLPARPGSQLLFVRFLGEGTLYLCAICQNVQGLRPRRNAARPIEMRGRQCLSATTFSHTTLTKNGCLACVCTCRIQPTEPNHLSPNSKPSREPLAPPTIGRIMSNMVSFRVLVLFLDLSLQWSMCWILSRTQAATCHSGRVIRLIPGNHKAVSAHAATASNCGYTTRPNPLRCTTLRTDPFDNVSSNVAQRQAHSQQPRLFLRTQP